MLHSREHARKLKTAHENSYTIFLLCVFYADIKFLYKWCNLPEYALENWWQVVMFILVF